MEQSGFPRGPASERNTSDQTALRDPPERPLPRSGPCLPRRMVSGHHDRAMDAPPLESREKRDWASSSGSEVPSSSTDAEPGRRSCIRTPIAAPAPTDRRPGRLNGYVGPELARASRGPSDPSEPPPYPVSCNRGDGDCHARAPFCTSPVAARWRKAGGVNHTERKGGDGVAIGPAGILVVMPSGAAAMPPLQDAAAWRPLTALSTNSTISSVAHPGVKTSATPSFFSSGMSSAGIVPPTVTTTSSAP